MHIYQGVDAFGHTSSIVVGWEWADCGAEGSPWASACSACYHDEKRAQQTSATGHRRVSGDLTCVAELFLSPIHSQPLSWDRKRHWCLEVIHIKSITDSSCRIIWCVQKERKSGCRKKISFYLQISCMLFENISLSRRSRFALRADSPAAVHIKDVIRGL